MTLTEYAIVIGFIAAGNALGLLFTLLLRK
jgi:hypothetical protein